MIKNGLYALHASSGDGVAEDVGGVLILRDSQPHGGDAYAAPDVIASLAKSTFNNLPPSKLRIISEAALTSFLEGADMLADPVKSR
jgi:hypothetical protein